jgi:hypothetical protein
MEKINVNSILEYDKEVLKIINIIIDSRTCYVNTDYSLTNINNRNILKYDYKNKIDRSYTIVSIKKLAIKL